MNQSTWEPSDQVNRGIPLSSPPRSDQTKQGPSPVEDLAREPGTSAVKAGFPLTPVYYPDVQNIMADLEAMSVMNEAILEDVEGEEAGSGAEDGVDRDVG